ncbi:MAG: hypothetical protein KDD47_25430, partial [Acidobacteria bacterium]|nr:hypothetical protein [Acidobacteriota bacterium]
SALDSGFSGDGVEVAFDSRSLRIAYRLSSANQRAVGVYPVVLRIYGPEEQLVDVRVLEVTYLPQGRSLLRFPTATFVAKDLLEDPEPLPGLEIHSVERVSRHTLSRGNTPRLFDEGQLPPTTDALRITYSLPVPTGNGGASRIEIRDLNASGVFRIPVDTPERPGVSCTDACEGVIEIPFQFDPAAAQNLRVQVTTHDQGWHGSGPTDKAWSSECDGDPDTPLPYCIEPADMVIRGHLTFEQRELRTHPTDFSHWLEPQYRHIDHTDSTRPASYVLVKALDACGRVAETFTDENGFYELALLTFCPSEPVQVWAYSFGAPIQGNDVALGIWTSETNPTPTEIGDLTKNNDDYTVVSGLVGSFVPDMDYPGGSGLTFDKHFGLNEPGPLSVAGKFTRLGEMSRALGILRTVRRILSYMGELVDVEKLPRINVVFTDEPLLGGDNTAVYFPKNHAMIYVPPRAEFSVFAPFHEAFHYFDEQTLGDFGTDPGDVQYGRWSEPLANVRAVMAYGGTFMPFFDDAPAENLDFNWHFVDGTPEAPPAVDPGESWSQGWIWRVAWDLSDGTGAEPLAVNGDDGYDQWNGWIGSTSDPNNSKLHRVIHDYLPQVGSFVVNADYQDRGLSGPDLVDLLDGMVCMYGLSEANSGTLLHDVMNYGYLYDHCQP